MKTITVWRDGNNLGSQFKDDDRVIGFEDLTKAEVADFIFILRQFADFYERFNEQRIDG